MLTDKELAETEKRANMVRDYYRKYPVENQLIQQDIPALMTEIRELRQVNRQLKGAVLDVKSRSYLSVSDQYMIDKAAFEYLAALVGEDGK